MIDRIRNSMKKNTSIDKRKPNQAENSGSSAILRSDQQSRTHTHAGDLFAGPLCHRQSRCSVISTAGSYLCRLSVSASIPCFKTLHSLQRKPEKMSILQMSLKIPSQSLSSSSFFSGENPLFLLTKLSHLSLTTTTTVPSKPPMIRMGGGPRTFPGGVSKWQWKRMQAKKSKQLLKARLARERQIYEMRKRAELQAAVSELERPWEVVQKAPTLFSSTADEQVKVLADRFQKPGGFDLWSEKDGPQLFDTVDGLPSSRFFPKGVVHSIKPYGRIGDSSNRVDELGENRGEIRVRENKLPDDIKNRNGNGDGFKGKLRKQRNRRNELGSNGEEPKNGRITKSGVIIRGSSTKSRRVRSSNPEVYDMNLQKDGSYEFGKEN